MIPKVLKACIPGCEKPGSHFARGHAGHRGRAHWPDRRPVQRQGASLDIDAPNGYTISGEGQGGVAGFAKGGATVHLTDGDAASTILKYAVQAQVGGKIAQLGARLINSTSKSLADTFFDNLTKELTLKMGPSPEPAFPSAPSAAAIPVSPAAVPRPAVNLWAMMPREPMGYPLAVWIGGILWILIFFLIVGPLL